MCRQSSDYTTCAAGLTVQAQEATNSTQTIIFPRQASDDDQQTHKMYVHSHRSFEPGAYCRPCCSHVCWRQARSSLQKSGRARLAPASPHPGVPAQTAVTAGEQATREYDWSKAKIDPTSHRFGQVDCKGQQSSVKQVSSLTADAQRANKQRFLEKPTLGALASQATHGLTCSRIPCRTCVLRRCCRSFSQIWMRACASSRWCHRSTTATRPLWVTRWGEQPWLSACCDVC